MLKHDMGKSVLLVQLNLVFRNGKSISDVGFDFPGPWCHCPCAGIAGKLGPRLTLASWLGNLTRIGGKLFWVGGKSGDLGPQPRNADP